MQERIRIAFFADVLQRHFDGVSNTIHQLADHMPDHIEPIFFVALPPRDQDNFQFPVYQLPYFSLPFYKEYRVGLPQRMPDLPKILAAFNPHLVHFTSPSLMGRYAIQYAGKHQLPLTCIYHTHFQSYMEYYFGIFPPLEWSMSKLAWRLSRWFYTQPDRTFVPSEPMKRYLLALGLNEGQIAYFKRGINTAQFGPQFRDDGIRKKWGLDNHKIVLFVSRLVEEKEMKTLKRLYDLLDTERDDVRLMVTGDGPARPGLEKHMKNAVFTGKQTKAELAAIYATSDVFVFPSITETFGNVVLEALASGLPAVVAAAGGPQGIVESAQGGYAVEPKNARAFADKVHSILDDPDLRQQLSSHGIAYAKKQDWNSICREYFDEVTALATKRSSQDKSESPSQ
ncbi:MAG: glycosyltransferase family 1 protein [Bacteroidota bacterium]